LLVVVLQRCWCSVGVTAEGTLSAVNYTAGFTLSREKWGEKSRQSRQNETAKAATNAFSKPRQLGGVGT